MRQRERRVARDAIHLPLVQAGFMRLPHRNVWRRDCGEVVQLIGCYGATRDGGRSLEWGSWLPRLAKLFGERDLHPPSDMTRTHLRAGDHRLPKELRSDRAVRLAVEAARAVTDSYLDLLSTLQTVDRTREYLTSNRQRLWPPAHLNAVTVAGLSVLHDDPRAADLAEDALAALTRDDPWLPVALHIREVARRS